MCLLDIISIGLLIYIIYSNYRILIVIPFTRLYSLHLCGIHSNDDYIFIITYVNDFDDVNCNTLNSLLLYTWPKKLKIYLDIKLLQLARKDQWTSMPIEGLK